MFLNLKSVVLFLKTLTLTVYHQDQRNAGNRTVRHSSIQCLHQDLIELYGTGQEIVLVRSSVLQRHCWIHE